MKTGQCAAGAFRSLHARCGLQCPHAAEGNAEATQRLRTLCPLPGIVWLVLWLVVGVGGHLVRMNCRV